MDGVKKETRVFDLSEKNPFTVDLTADHPGFIELRGDITGVPGLKDRKDLQLGAVGFDPEALRMYGELDDNDIWSAMKSWRHSDDKILARLAGDLLDRRLWRCEMTSEPFTVERGERIAQLILARHETIEWEECTELSGSERGAGGFGSTGK